MNFDFKPGVNEDGQLVFTTDVPGVIFTSPLPRKDSLQIAEWVFARQGFVLPQRMQAISAAVEALLDALPPADCRDDAVNAKVRELSELLAIEGSAR